MNIIRTDTSYGRPNEFLPKFEARDYTRVVRGLGSVMLDSLRIDLVYFLNHTHTHTCTHTQAHARTHIHIGTHKVVSGLAPA